MHNPVERVATGVVEGLNTAEVGQAAGGLHLVGVWDPSNSVHNHWHIWYWTFIWKEVEQDTSDLLARELQSEYYATCRDEIRLPLNYVR